MRPKRGYYDVFIKTCAKYPSKVAVRHYDGGFYKTYTYSELYGVCEYFAQNLQQLQCNKGIIGLVSERNMIIPCIIAAAHKCCTTFMFLDPSADIESLAYEVNLTVVIIISTADSQVKTELFGKKPEKTVSVFNLLIKFFSYDHTSCHENKHICQHSFIALTSGTSGEPKQIQVPIQCIQPNIDDLTKLFDITPKDIIYFSTPLTFDPSMVEILLACMNGASLLIAPEIVDVIFPENKEHAITFWQTTPSKFFQHSNADMKNKIFCANSTLRILALGGEPLNGIKRLKEMKDKDNNTRIFALYGVTEMSCWASVAEIDLNKILIDREVPLGNCLSETQIFVEPIEENNKCIGRIKLVSKTRKCIVLNRPQRSGDSSSHKSIDTGDIGEIKSGTIYYRGRTDDIIKRFGHKVNLQVIESTIMQCPKVKTCASIWLPKPRLLIVYFSSETLTSQELSDFLKCKLDEKHWPDKIVRVDNLPTSPHGKTSKKMLSQMFDMASTLPITLDSLKVSFLKELKVAISQSFTYDQIKDMDFFAIGGTSFLAVSMCNKLSLTCPKFGNLILPYLMGQKNTIDEIMLLAAKEICSASPKKMKRRMKRCRSVNECESGSLKRVITESQIDNPAIEFLVMWSYNTKKCVDASPTLFQTGFNLFVTVGSHSGKVVIMDARAGTRQGALKVKSRVEASVLCYQDAELSRGVVGTYDGTIVCFSLEDCAEFWKINIESMIKSKAVCCRGLLYVAAYDGNIRCIDITNGEIKEVIRIVEQGISADLVLAKQEYVLLGSLSGVCASIQTGSNAVCWRGTLGAAAFGAPVLYDADKYVVFADVGGEIHCRTVEKGIKIWKYQGARGNVFSSMYVREVNQRWQIVFGCHDNHVYSLLIKNFQPTLQWKVRLSSPVYSTPCALTDKLLLATSNNGKMSVIESDNGTLIAEYLLPNETFSSPAVYGDYIFIGCRDDHLYALKYILNF